MSSGSYGYGRVDACCALRHRADAHVRIATMYLLDAVRDRAFGRATLAADGEIRALAQLTDARDTDATASDLLTIRLAASGAYVSSGDDR